MSPGDVARLRERIEKYKRERARVRDPAIGAGGAVTPEDLVQLDETEGRTKAEFGPEGSRVRVRIVLPRSPGDGAGLLPGDIILSYNGQPVAGVKALRDLSRQPTSEKSLPIVFQRDAEIMTGKIKPGPLGMFLDDVAERP